MSNLVFLANLVASGVMTGVIWFVQIVHYPLFAQVSPEHWQHYHRLHSTQTSYVVVGPMLVEFGLGFVLLVVRPPALSLSLAAVCCGLGVVTWLLTFGVAVPLHNRLTQGYNAATITRLVHTNWLRTAAWTARFAVLVYALVRMLP